MLKEEEIMTTTTNMRRRPAKFQQKFPGEIGAAAVYLMTRAASCCSAWDGKKFGGAAVESLISTKCNDGTPAHLAISPAQPGSPRCAKNTGSLPACGFRYSV